MPLCDDDDDDDDPFSVTPLPLVCVSAIVGIVVVPVAASLDEVAEVE